MTSKDKTPPLNNDSKDSSSKKKSLGDAVHDFVGEFVLNIPKKPIEEKIAFTI